MHAGCADEKHLMHVHVLNVCQFIDMACRCVLVACITVVPEHVLCDIATDTDTDTHRHTYRQGGWQADRHMQT